MIYVLGGSGAPLNYKVVGGSSAPSNPKENTIWVNTSTEITSHVFSATQPTGEEGMVWFKTSFGGGVDFNALKKNGIQVYPVNAAQYISGTFVTVTAEIYQNGEWNGLIRWLYNSGDQCTSVTGGWESGTYTLYGYKLNGSLAADNMNFLFASGSAYGGVGTKNKVDMSGYTKLCASVKGPMRMLACSSKTIGQLAGITSADTGSRTLSLSIANIDSAYVAFLNDYSTRGYVYKVWLE